MNERNNERNGEFKVDGKRSIKYKDYVGDSLPSLAQFREGTDYRTNPGAYIPKDRPTRVITGVGDGKATTTQEPLRPDIAAAMGMLADPSKVKELEGFVAGGPDTDHLEGSRQGWDVATIRDTPDNSAIAVHENTHVTQFASERARIANMGFVDRFRHNNLDGGALEEVLRKQASTKDAEATGRHIPNEKEREAYYRERAAGYTDPTRVARELYEGYKGRKGDRNDPYQRYLSHTEALPYMLPMRKQ